MTSVELTEGDWVQATEAINDDSLRLKCARNRSVGQVVGLPEDEEWFTVYWERTGTVMDCHASQLTFLCHADARPRLAIIGTECERVADLIREATNLMDVTVCRTPEEVAQISKVGGTVWGVKHVGGSPPLGAGVTEYLYFKDAALDLPEVVRWKLRATLGLY